MHEDDNIREALAVMTYEVRCPRQRATVLEEQSMKGEIMSKHGKRSEQPTKERRPPLRTTFRQRDGSMATRH